jgi:hypothetical protein
VAIPTPHHVTCQIKFRQSGLHLNFKMVDAGAFAAKINSLPAAPTFPSAPDVEHSWSTNVGLFNSDDNRRVLAFDRVTHILFFSDDKNWWFYPPGFDTKEAAAMANFSAIERINNGTGLRVTFSPSANPPVAGLYMPYNVYMRTVVWQSGAKNGHATIIIDPVFETGTVRQ